MAKIRHDLLHYNRLSFSNHMAFVKHLLLHVQISFPLKLIREILPDLSILISCVYSLQIVSQDPDYLQTWRTWF